MGSPVSVGTMFPIETLFDVFFSTYCSWPYFDVESF